jgi:hypothetical protein
LILSDNVHLRKVSGVTLSNIAAFIKVKFSLAWTAFISSSVIKDFGVRLISVFNSAWAILSFLILSL